MWFSLTSFLSSRMAGGMAELTLRQEKFVQALTTPQTPTYCRPSAAYRTISPAIVPGAVHVGAFRMLRDDNVQQAIRGQLGLGQLGNKLKKCLRETEKLKDWPQVRETVMDYAKLTGQLVEKREIRTLTDEQSHAIRVLVRQTFGNGVITTRSQPVPSMPPATSLPPTLSAPSSEAMAATVSPCNSDAADASRPDPGEACP